MANSFTALISNHTSKKDCDKGDDFEQKQIYNDNVDNNKEEKKVNKRKKHPIFSNEMIEYCINESHKTTLKEFTKQINIKFPNLNYKITQQKVQTTITAIKKTMLDQIKRFEQEGNMENANKLRHIFDNKLNVTRNGKPSTKKNILSTLNKYID